MAIPNTSDINLPLLKHVASGKEFHINEIVAALAEQFHLTDEEIRREHKSGAKIFKNNIQWSSANLKLAGLLESPRRGYKCIASEGQKLLGNPPAIIDHRFLMQYPSYAEKTINRAKDKSKPNEAHNDTAQARSDTTPEQAAYMQRDLGRLEDQSDTTPEQAMSEAQSRQESAVADEILERVRTVSPRGFEELILKLLDKMGYGSENGSSRHLGGSGDGGVDGVVDQDALGLDRVYIQAKRYRDGASVGSPAIREFSGSLNEQRVQKGLFITSSAFSKSSIDAARSVTQNIVLINGRELVKLMLKHDVGVRVKTTYKLKDVDEDFFEDL